MMASQRRRLHRAIAAWHERTFRGDLTPYLGLLARHWGLAGDRGRELGYLERAGDHALREGAYREAAAAFEAALADPGEQRDRADPLPRATGGRLLLRHGTALMGLGRFARANSCLLEATAALRRRMPGTTVGVVGGLAVQVLKQAVARNGGQHEFARPATHPGSERAAVGAYERLAETYYFDGDALRTIYSTIRAANLAEAAELPAAMARAYANVAVAASLVPMHGVSRRYAAMATAAAGSEAVDGAERLDTSTGALVLSRRGMCLAGVGAWEQADDALGRARGTFAGLGDLRRLGEATTLAENVAYLQGDYDRGAGIARELLPIGERARDVQQIGWSHDGVIANLLRMGRLDEARVLIDVALPRIAAGPDRVEEAVCRSHLAALLWAEGRAEPAREQLRRIDAVVLTGPIVAFYAYKVLENFGHTWLALWAEAQRVGRADPEARTKALAACRRARQYTRIFPIGKPLALTFAALAALARGRQGRADRLAHVAAREAERLGMAGVREQAERLQSRVQLL